MKKLSILLLFLLLLFFSSIRVNAANISTSMSGVKNIDAHGSFSVSISVSGTNVWGVMGDLSYDSSKLELISSTGQNGFTATVGSRVVLDSVSGHDGTFVAAILTFKAKDSFVAGQSTTISLNNIQGSTDSERLSGTGCSQTITVNIPKSTDNSLASLEVNGSLISGFNSNVNNYTLPNTDATSINITASTNDSKAKITGVGSKSLNYGVNTFNILVTAENGSVRNYQITISRNDKRSSNNYLDSLQVKGTNIKFNKNTFNYSVNVENDISSVEIVAKASDSKSKVTGIGTKKLDVYVNTFTISVIAENGSVRNYVIRINRKDEKGNLGGLSKNNKLKELTIEGYDIQFNKDVNEYQLEVDNVVEFVKVNAVLDDEKSILEMDNPTKLKVGNNQIKILVIAENGDKNTYVINVVRKDNTPITTIDKSIEILDKITTSKIEIEIKDNVDTFDKKLTNKLKEKEIEVVIKKYNDDNKLLYVWRMDAKNFVKDFEFNSKISFDSGKQDAIDKLTNYSNSFYLNFLHSGDLPKGTLVTVYVGNMYIDGEEINLYYYNEKENKIEMVSQKLLVENGGYVTFEIKHCSDYFLSKAIVKNGTNISFVIAIIESVIILFLLIFISYKMGLFDKIIKKDLVKKSTKKTKKKV